MQKLFPTTKLYRKAKNLQRKIPASERRLFSLPGELVNYETYGQHPKLTACVT